MNHAILPAVILIMIVIVVIMNKKRERTPACTCNLGPDSFVSCRRHGFKHARKLIFPHMILSEIYKPCYIRGHDDDIPGFYKINPKFPTLIKK
jgi:hypothetical protein